MVESEAPALRAVRHVLRMTVAAVLAGAAAEAMYGHGVGDMLVQTWGLREESAMRVEPLAAWLLAVGAVLTLVYPCGPVLLPAAGWVAATALARTMSPGLYYELQVAAAACGILAPVALVFVARWPRHEHVSLRRLGMMAWTLRIAAALTFAAHGFMAIGNHPQFVMLLSGARERVGVETSAATASAVLTCIGAANVLMALAVAMGRFRFVVTCMAGWAAAVAASRFAVRGWEAYPQVLLGLADVGVPLALLVYWHKGRGTAVLEVERSCRERHVTRSPEAQEVST